MITIEIDTDFRPLIDQLLLQESAQLTLESAEISQESDLTIVITDNAYIQRLNAEYREIDAPTDVLSFPAHFTNPENDTPYLGDVVISYPRAYVQAEERGHTVAAELQLLVVHGVLHLLEFDHTAPQEKIRMWQIQSQILGELGLGEIHIEE